jgi:hypothetical protein
MKRNLAAMAVAMSVSAASVYAGCAADAGLAIVRAAATAALAAQPADGKARCGQ